MSVQSKSVYEFGRFRLDASQRLLFRDGSPVDMAPKTFDALLVLVENAGRVVERETLLQLVWHDAFVEEGSLTSQISILRKQVLAIEGEAAQYIKTVPKRGYCFVADVKEFAPGDASVIVRERHVLSQTTIDEEEEDEGVVEAPAQQPALPGGLALAQERLALKARTRWRSPGVLAAALAVLLIAGVAAIYLRTRESSGRAQTGGTISVRSIAVLPFRDLAGSGDDQYLKLGLADALITKLSNIRQLAVRPTSAIIKYGEQAPDPVRAGRELKVDAVLAGNFQRLGDSVRVTVQLVNVSDGATLWAETFDGQVRNIFELQDSISVRAAGELTQQLSNEEKVLLAKQQTHSSEADQLFWKGRFLMKQPVRTPETVGRAIEYFKQAVERDPQFALAHAELAGAYESAAALNLMPPPEAFPQAQRAVEQALRLDEALPEAHVVMATIKWEYEWKWEEAEGHYRRAIALNPNLAAAHHNYAELLSMMGRHDEAIAESEQARQLDPLSANYRAVASLLLLYARRYDDSIREAEATLELEPNSYLAHMYQAAAYEAKGMFDEATAAVLKGRALSGGAFPDVAMLARMHARSGRLKESQSAFDELKRLDVQGYVDPTAYVIVYEARGEKAEALDWMEEAYKARSFWVTTWKVNYHYDNLRSEPRFKELLGRLKFPQS